MSDNYEEIPTILNQNQFMYQVQSAGKNISFKTFHSLLLRKQVTAARQNLHTFQDHMLNVTFRKMHELHKSRDIE